MKKPFFFRFLPAVLLAASVFSFSSCKQDVTLDQGMPWHLTLPDGPFSLTLAQTEGSTVELPAEGEASALWYITSAGTQYLTTRRQVRKDNDTLYVAEYATTDDRRATVTLSKGPSGILQVTLRITPDDGIRQTGLTLAARPGEQYYGLMERTVDGDQKKSWDPATPGTLSLRGQQVTMTVRPTLGIYEPFYVSSAGYGLFVHGLRPGHYDLGATDSSRVRVRFDDTQLSFSLLPGPAMQEVLQRLPLLTGRSIIPPQWAFRPLRWRDEHVNRKKYYDGTRVTAPYNSQLVEDLLMAKAYDIPLGAYWVDRPWAAGAHGYGNLRWDPVRFPDARGMIDWINGKGMRFLVWIAPWATDSLLVEAGEKGYLMPGMEELPDSKKKNKTWLIDFTNPAAVAWWKELLKKRLIGMGVAGFKMDRSEEIIAHIDTLTLQNGTKIHDMRNSYPRLYLRAAHDALQEMRGDDFLAMPRAAYTGSQQYGVFWGGDIGAGAYGLRTALIAVQRCAFMNFPLWGSDIGGYWKHPLSHYNMARWLAFGAFTPIMEVGPVDNRAPWDMPYRPSYDTTLIAIYRMYSILHDTLQGYTHTMAVKASEEGMPIVRPLVLLFPGDPEVTKRWDEYMYGDNLLVGIPWKEGQHTFEMYLPQGSWKDAWTGKAYEGGQTVTLDCPDYKIPLFVTGENAPALPDLEQLYEESLKIASVKPDLAQLQREEFGK